MADRPTQHDVPAGEPAQGGHPPRPPAPEPSHAERCRTLVAQSNRGSLATLATDPAGHPFGSVATYGLDDGGNPIFFVSLMAEHTQNARRDPRASLLVAEPVPDGTDPLAGGRVTLLGRLSAVEREQAQEPYLAANPTAAYYIDFGDFVFYRLAVERIRYVGGYGRMSWVGADEYAAAEPDPLAPAAAAIVGHMNADHAEAQVLYCRHLAGHPGATAATMSAVDRYGFEMVAEGPAGRVAVRLGFPAPCATADEVRRAMVAMAGEARRLRDAGPGAG